MILEILILMFASIPYIMNSTIFIFIYESLVVLYFILVFCAFMGIITGIAYGENKKIFKNNKTWPSKFKSTIVTLFCTCFTYAYNNYIIVMMLLFIGFYYCYIDGFIKQLNEENNNG